MKKPNQKSIKLLISNKLAIQNLERSRWNLKSRGKWGQGVVHLEYWIHTMQAAFVLLIQTLLRLFISKNLKIKKLCSQYSYLKQSDYQDKYIYFLEWEQMQIYKDNVKMQVSTPISWKVMEWYLN